MSDKVGVQPPPPYGYQQPGYQPYPPGGNPPGGYQPGYQPMGYQPSTVYVVQQPLSVGRTVPPGACRHCGIGFPKSEFTMLGILIAILIFPFGIICCLMTMETRCSHCRALLS